MHRILFIFGTRPEAIKMAPLIKEIQKKSDIYSLKICVTAQHREMLDQVLNFFNINPDYDLDLMKPNQSLFNITVACIKGLEKIFIEYILRDFLGHTISIPSNRIPCYIRWIKHFEI